MVTLSTVSFKNFRCFEEHEVIVGNKSLLVGKNNAGKSTCIEGLRLISLVTQRLGNLTVKDPPRGIGLAKRHRGVSPRVDSISIQKECLFHRYGDPPAQVKGSFSNGSSIELFIKEDSSIHAIIRDSKGMIAKNKPATLQCGIPKVSILPQIGPVQSEEPKRNDSYIQRNLETNLASLHFRNQLRILKEEYYEQFCELASSTWNGLKIERLDLPDVMDTEGRLALIVRDSDFSAEIAWMGHGLQMWMQTMWFLARSKESSVLILDEPDVYLHADLQRKLIRLLLQDQRQFIIATHSAEMMSEVQPSSIVVLDRARKKSVSANSNSAVQVLLEQVGSVHNLSLARIGIHKKIILVEGKDVPVLKRFQDALGNYNSTPIDILPNTGIGGWSKWPSVLTIADFFRKNADGDIQIFCVLDRDYHTQSEIDKRMDEAREKKVHLTVWGAKELENYIISPAPIQRILEKKGVSLTVDEVTTAIRTQTEVLRQETEDSVSEFIRLENRKLGADKTNPMARKYVQERVEKVGLEMVVNGKKLFSGVISSIQGQHKVSFSLNQVLNETKPDEVHPDIVSFMKAIEA